MKLTVKQLKRLISESLVSEVEGSEQPLLVCTAIEADQSVTLAFPSGDEDLFDRCCRVMIPAFQKYGTVKTQGDSIVISRIDNVDIIEDIVNHAETVFSRMAGPGATVGQAPEGADFGFTVFPERKRDISQEQAYAEEIVQATIDDRRIPPNGWAPLPASVDLHGLVGQFSVAIDGNSYDLYIDENGDEPYIKRIG